MTGILGKIGPQTRQHLFSPTGKKIKPLQRLMITYVTVLVVVLVLVTGKELLISFAVGQQRASQAIAQTVGKQRSRVFTFLMNAIELQEGVGNREALLNSIEETDITWEQVQAAALNPAGSTVLQLPWWQPGFPQAVIDEVQGSSADYNAILQAITQIEMSKPGSNLEPAIHTLALHVPAYQDTFLTVYNELSAQADTQVQDIARIEFVLYLLTIVCVFFEAFVVIRPTLRELKDLVTALQALIKEQENP